MKCGRHHFSGQLCCGLLWHLCLSRPCIAWVAPRFDKISRNVQSVASADDDNARSAFGTRDYWDEVYQGRGDFPSEEYSWYYGFEKYGKFVKEYIQDKSSRILLPGVGNDPIMLDLLNIGYHNLTATDYSDHAIERQLELLSYESYPEDSVELFPMDARKMEAGWTNRFDAIIEKGALDAIYLSGDGNLEKSVKEFERILKPGGVLISVSGVVPEELRREIFADWNWIRDGSADLQAGCFLLSLPAE